MDKKWCGNCKHESLGSNTHPCNKCLWTDEKDHSKWESTESEEKQKIKTGITFPILNNLTPTVESCTMKLLEEVGEVMQMLGKGQGLSGEASYTVKQVDELEYNILLALEAMDVAQSAVTMVHTICSHYGIIMEDVITSHTAKLRQRGYLK